MKILINHRSLVLLLGLVLLAGSFLPLAASLENRLYAGLSRLLPEQALPAKTLVVTMGNTVADGADFSRAGAGQAFSYTQLVRLLGRLKAAGVSAIGLALPLDHAQ